MTISSFLRTLPIVSEALSKGVRSGRLFLFTGVGTPIIKTLQGLSFSMLLEKIRWVALQISSLEVSRVWSFPFLSSSMRASLISNPTVENILPNSTAKGRHT